MEIGVSVAEMNMRRLLRKRMPGRLSEASESKLRAMREAKRQRQSAADRAWRMELNQAHREAALERKHPDHPGEHNADLFLLGELYLSAISLSSPMDPVWRCPVK